MLPNACNLLSSVANLPCVADRIGISSLLSQEASEWNKSSG